jgi:site-specific DNA-methyltransferase (adenine-specific)
MNKLYYGDCLTVLEKIPLNSVDLVYLDPPFNSNRNYNAIYKDETGNPLPEQVEAFCDTWELTPEREREARTVPALMRSSGIDHDTADLWGLWMKALRKTQPSLLAYMTYMVPRLLRIYPLMKPTASLYYHCDPTASHYIKPFLDAIFDHQNFRNEIIWSYRRWPARSYRFQTMHDVILYYSRGPKPTFNVSYEPPSDSYLKRFKGKTQVLDPERKTRKIVVDEPTKGMPLRDVWELSILAGSSKERMGYATQKPLKLLNRIIETSTNEGDLVLDPFCGCATTLESAQRLGRRWIGIDIAIHAIKRVAQVRLVDRCGLQEGVHFEVDGIPNSIESAEALWKQDKYQFQKWAVEQVDGFCTTRQSADGGVDGRTYFYAEEYKKDIQNMIVEVKGGKRVGVGVLRELRGVVDREDALLGCLIVQYPPSKQQQRQYDKEIIGAGTIKLNGWEYPRLQVLSVPEILEGKRPEVPRPIGRREPQPALLPVV